MKQSFILINWKSHKTQSEVREWFLSLSAYTIPEDRKIILFAPFTSLPVLKELITKYKSPIMLGAQNISPFQEGSYTGEIYGGQIKEFADYVLIGHSERKKYFSETEEMLQQKIRMAQFYKLTPLYFIQNEEAVIPGDIEHVVYEPPTAISPGIPETPEKVNTIAEKLLQEYPGIQVYYGGNVTTDNIHAFVHSDSLHGVIIGRASLSIDEFKKVLEHA